MPEKMGNPSFTALFCTSLAENTFRVFQAITALVFITPARNVTKSIILKHLNQV
jgi:hypothetical protein